jgi:hypothetical protein
MTRILSQNYHNTKPKYNWQHKELHNLYKWMNVKVKVSRYRPGVAQRVGKATALPFVDRVTRSGWVVSSTPRPHFTPRERPGTHFTGGCVGPQGWPGRAENLVPTGIRSRTVQPVVIRYIDWATRPTSLRQPIYFTVGMWTENCRCLETTDITATVEGSRRNTGHRSERVKNLN